MERQSREQRFARYVIEADEDRIFACRIPPHLDEDRFIAAFIGLGCRVAMRRNSKNPILEIEAPPHLGNPTTLEVVVEQDSKVTLDREKVR
jgi:hypothetical protein